MITILTTTENSSAIKEIVDSVNRLNELVSIVMDNERVQTADKILFVNDERIYAEIDWFDTEPPYVFPAVELNHNNLLALLFYKLGNEQQAFHYVEESDTFYGHLLLATKLKFGYTIENEELADLNGHNKAIVNHYGNLPERISFDDLKRCYLDALNQDGNGNLKWYTAKHYLSLLLDGQCYEEAITTCESFLKEIDSDAAKMALQVQWCSASYKNLRLPYAKESLEAILVKQEECIKYLESNALHLNASLLAMEACDVANFLGDFPSAKEYINKAIKTFKEEGVQDFLGEAGLKKAHLLYHWSKNGSPQYYKAAINAFQDTLKIFKRDSHPEYFAEIQHSLGLLYSEIPAAPDEKPMWTAFCASAFKEALEIYKNQEKHYEYAMVCHNYATALMDFPPAKLHNNHEKADGYFEEALKVRTSEKYPTERALTLLNQLELGWLMHNSDEKEEEQRLETMRKKADEVKSLVSDEKLLNRAKEQLEKLERLKTII